MATATEAIFVVVRLKLRQHGLGLLFVSQISQLDILLRCAVVFYMSTLCIRPAWHRGKRIFVLIACGLARRLEFGGSRGGVGRWRLATVLALGNEVGLIAIVVIRRSNIAIVLDVVITSAAMPRIAAAATT